MGCCDECGKLRWVATGSRMAESAELDAFSAMPLTGVSMSNERSQAQGQ